MSSRVQYYVTVFGGQNRGLTTQSLPDRQRPMPLDLWDSNGSGNRGVKIIRYLQTLKRQWYRKSDLHDVPEALACQANTALFQSITIAQRACEGIVCISCRYAIPRSQARFDMHSAVCLHKVVGIEFRAILIM
jgi:hypothetical protein